MISNYVVSSLPILDSTLLETTENALIDTSFLNDKPTTQYNENIDSSELASTDELISSSTNIISTHIEEVKSTDQKSDTISVSTNIEEQIITTSLVNSTENETTNEDETESIISTHIEEIKPTNKDEEIKPINKDEETITTSLVNTTENETTNEDETESIISTHIEEVKPTDKKTDTISVSNNIEEQIITTSLVNTIENEATNKDETESIISTHIEEVKPTDKKSDNISVYTNKEEQIITTSLVNTTENETSNEDETESIISTHIEEVKPTNKDEEIITTSLVNTTENETTNEDETESIISTHIEEIKPTNKEEQIITTSLVNTTENETTNEDKAESIISTHIEEIKPTNKDEEIITTSLINTTENETTNEDKTESITTTIVSITSSIIIPKPSTQKLILLGFGNFNNETSRFSFNTYFISTTNITYSRNMNVKLTLIQSDITNASIIEKECTSTLQSRETDIKGQYLCEVDGNITDIKQIKVGTDFKFDTENNVTLVGITPLAKMYINNIQDIGNKFDNFFNSDIYILDNCNYLKYGKLLFNISGVMNINQPNITNDNIILMMNSDSDTDTGDKTQIEVNCSIKNNIDNNYTLNCKSIKKIKGDLQAAISFVGHNLLLLKLDDNYNSHFALDENSNSFGRFFFRNNKGGISAGAIVAIIIACAVAIISIMAIWNYRKKANNNNNIITESSITKLN